MNQDYIDSSISQLVAELEVWGEVAEFRGLPIMLIKNTTKQTKEMVIAGYYDETAFDAIIAPTDPKPAVNELITYESEQYFVREVEEFEYKTGYRLVLQLAK
jgi:hypothetical protein